MKINETVIEKLWNTWKNKRTGILKGKTKGFTLYEGGKIVTTKLKNFTGWYAVVCFYDTPDLYVDVYDMHVFDRYKERFMKGVDKDPITEFMNAGNYEGTMLIKEEGRFEKKIKDGATLGTINKGIVYHKTFLTDDMCRENKMDYLFDI